VIGRKRLRRTLLSIGRGSLPLEHWHRDRGGFDLLARREPRAHLPFPEPSTPSNLAAVLIPIATHLGVFVAWSLAAGLALVVLPLPWGAIAALGVYLAILRFYVLGGNHSVPRRRVAILGLRPLRGAVLRGTLAAIPVFVVFSWALGAVYAGVVPVPDETLNPFPWLTDRSLGRLSLALLAIGIAPMLEECFFRGLIQRPLVKRWGAVGGIGVAAALFAVVHVLPWVLPVHLALGAAFGAAAYASRSLYAAVLLHAANNAVALLGLPTADAPEAPRLIWETGLYGEWLLALGALAVSTAAGTRLIRRIHRAARMR
jgi:membrane protease YdiL (CAAX protease family)